MFKRAVAARDEAGAMVQTKISEAGAMVQTSAQRALGVGPLHEHSATMRAYISEMRRRYISMWQLGLIAGILQLLCTSSPRTR